MIIWVNQKEHTYDAPLTLINLVKQLGKANKTGIAIAVNNTVIPKNNWTELLLKEQDKVTIITATQGG
ncbi:MULTISPECIES: sulfur carrier protein ThiS [unclassified Aureispira]|uniref:sulfur carrier protein ThiS n=1 Tax=unclassified Aureispira TaxID=2649989 RepID=UPI0006963554|nr:MULTISPECIES: sulfur carrier protein ThiS [unclassified Aureispira]WMX12795.1 sulfur carrier protein ThiS [Aureispira sp. CCB-E]